MSTWVFRYIGSKVQVEKGILRIECGVLVLEKSLITRIIILVKISRGPKGRYGYERCRKMSPNTSAAEQWNRNIITRMDPIIMPDQAMNSYIWILSSLSLPSYIKIQV